MEIICLFDSPGRRLAQRMSTVPSLPNCSSFIIIFYVKCSMCGSPKTINQLLFNLIFDPEIVRIILYLLSFHVFKQSGAKRNFKNWLTASKTSTKVLNLHMASFIHMWIKSQWLQLRFSVQYLLSVGRSVLVGRMIVMCVPRFYCFGNSCDLCC